MTATITGDYLELVFSDRTVSVLVPAAEIVLDGFVMITGQDGQTYNLNATDFTSPTFASNALLYAYLQTNAI